MKAVLARNGQTRGWPQCGGDDCLGRTFRTKAELKQSAWHNYFESVYGLDTMNKAYPFSLVTLQFFYWDMLPERGIPFVAQDDVFHIQPGHHLNYGGLYQMKALAGVFGGQAGHSNVWRFWHRQNTGKETGRTGVDTSKEPELGTGLPSHTIVEVRHICCDKEMSWRPRDGFWMYLAPGSGVFFNLGKTIATSSHGELWYELGCTRDFVDAHRDAALGEYDETIAPTWILEYACARFKGYDSVQYTHFYEGTIVKYEVVHLKDLHPQKDACPAKAFASRYTSGWDGSRPCHCKPGSTEMNCNG